jgi:hypothetical protein
MQRDRASGFAPAAAASSGTVRALPESSSAIPSSATIGSARPKPPAAKQHLGHRESRWLLAYARANLGLFRGSDGGGHAVLLIWPDSPHRMVGSMPDIGAQL